MDTQDHTIYHVWIHFIPTSVYPRREKTIWSELELNPGPLASLDHGSSGRYLPSYAPCPSGNLSQPLFQSNFLFSIGYPVVTLGFGFKSYVGYRMRQRRQREVQKENEYYYQFLREALPPGVREDAFNPHPSPKPCKFNLSSFALLQAGHAEV